MNKYKICLNKKIVQFDLLVNINQIQYNLESKVNLTRYFHQILSILISKSQNQGNFNHIHKFNFHSINLWKMGSCISKQSHQSHSLDPSTTKNPQLMEKDKRNPHPLVLTFLTNEIIRSTSMPYKMKASQAAIKFTTQLFEKFQICKAIQSLLEDVAYTQDEAQTLSQSLIQGITNLEFRQTAEQKKNVQQLFNKSNLQLIKNENLFYYGMIDKLINQNQNLTNKNVKNSSKSRIYHKIANIKRQREIDQLQINQFQMECWKINSYKQLSDQELDEVVKYEAIGQQINRMGDRLNFRFKSIKNESQRMENLLKFSVIHLSTIEAFRFDLSEDEVMKMAQISRQACEHYDNGIFLLLVYFVTACQKQAKVKTTLDIQNKLQEMITIISNKYPPGQGLSKQQKHLENALKQCQNPSNYNKINFQHQTIKLKPQQKQKQVQDIITNYSIIAERNKSLFQQLVMSTCLQRCVYFLIGLKYNPHNPNPKALTRIKEKMFFKKDQNKNKSLQKTIIQTLTREQSEYKSMIDDILKDTEVIQFKISDMLRGKCIFLEISDIIQTINDIKQFVRKDSRFQISQIQSRFTKALPISDVTLKLIINKEIVAQLQLSIQTNAASYNFAHKIYELQRTKVFSKLKIIHNYFEESNSQFRQLASKSLLLLNKDSAISQKDCKIIRTYFNFQSLEVSTFRQVMSHVVDSKKSKIPYLSFTVDPHIQKLMIPLFYMKFQLWDKELGKIINNTLTDNNLSVQLKSVLISFFFKQFSISRQTERMQQFCLSQKDQNEMKYMQQYLNKYFSLNKVFKYNTQNYRIFHRGQQLLQINFAKDYSDYENQPIQLRKGRIIIGLVKQEHSLDKVLLLKQLLSFYFVTRQQNGKLYDEFSHFYTWLLSEASKLKQSQASSIINEAYILKAQSLLENDEIDDAEVIIKEAFKFFKSKQDYSRTLDCQILLCQCFIRLSKDKQLDELVNYHKKMVIEKAKTLGLMLRGTLFADSMWRISNILRKRISKKQQKKRLLETFQTMAITELSATRQKQFINALKLSWSQFALYGLQEPKIKENPSITYTKFQGLGNEGCQHLIRANWKNLIVLDLWNNSIETKGSEYLSKGNWKNLTNLQLGSNSIRAKGCQYLVQGDWKNLNVLDLTSNQIGVDGCRQIIKGNWKKLSALYLWGNSIGVTGCKQLIKGDWKNLSILNLSVNQISADACQIIIKADWKKLTTLYLRENSIGNKGCEYLSKSNWRNLNTLQLDDNSIQAIGCSQLIKAEWKDLISLYLNDNHINDQGCKYLSKGEWSQLTLLQIKNNSIKAPENIQGLFSQKNFKAFF